MINLCVNRNTNADLPDKNLYSDVSSSAPFCFSHCVTISLACESRRTLPTFELRIFQLCYYIVTKFMIKWHVDYLVASYFVEIYSVLSSVVVLTSAPPDMKQTHCCEYWDKWLLISLVEKFSNSALFRMVSYHFFRYTQKRKKCIK